MQGTEIHDPTKELAYSVKKGGLFILGKNYVHSVGHGIGDVLHHGSFLGGAVGASTIAGIATIGLSGLLSGALTQIDFLHRKETIKDMYKDELAARLNKPINLVDKNDLDVVAKDNKVIAQEMNQIKKQRAFGIGLSMMASMAVPAVVTFALPAVAGLLAGGAAITAAGGVMAAGSAALGSLGFGGAIISGLTALMSYTLVKEPLHHVADKLFNLDYKTTHDVIMGLKKQREFGKNVTPEQVLSVYVAANPELGQMIKQEYGAPFDQLSPEKKHIVAKDLNKIIPLERLANDINSGKINATELAFSVEGQLSGVQFGVPEAKPGMVEKFVDGCKKAFTFSKAKEESVPALGAVARHYDQNVMNQHTNGKPGHSHVKARGLKPKDPEKGYVEIVETQSDASLTLRQ